MGRSAREIELIAADSDHLRTFIRELRTMIRRVATSKSGTAADLALALEVKFKDVPGLDL